MLLALIAGGISLVGSAKGSMYLMLVGIGVMSTALFAIVIGVYCDPIQVSLSFKTLGTESKRAITEEDLMPTGSEPGLLPPGVNE